MSPPPGIRLLRPRQHEPREPRQAEEQQRSLPAGSRTTTNSRGVLTVTPTLPRGCRRGNPFDETPVVSGLGGRLQASRNGVSAAGREVEAPGGAEETGEGAAEAAAVINQNESHPDLVYFKRNDRNKTWLNAISSDQHLAVEAANGGHKNPTSSTTCQPFSRHELLNIALCLVSAPVKEGSETEPDGRWGIDIPGGGWGLVLRSSVGEREEWQIFVPVSFLQDRGIR
ncbi:hypothetical protein QBC32DRAFT_50471 [Pseudoneurospora amorphoporcata]|uniref:Uncharacterized protein n=1 Tax=Pseudoneurospora amorphoporcata TaxID=241081 RepID=A0AAN6NR88_9PEZI|nr:hypothetical protein QBC32DRAFT_50471 [Pseudoneurospora amorphoporcata]